MSEKQEMEIKKMNQSMLEAAKDKLEYNRQMNLIDERDYAEQTAHAQFQRQRSNEVFAIATRHEDDRLKHQLKLTENEYATNQEMRVRKQEMDFQLAMFNAQSSANYQIIQANNQARLSIATIKHNVMGRSSSDHHVDEDDVAQPEFKFGPPDDD